MRGRRITALVATALLTLAVAGCGGGEDLAPQVPGPPAEVKVPQAAQAPGDAAAAAQNTAGDSDTSTDSTTGTDSSGSASGDATATPTPAAGADQNGGTAAPDTTADGPTNDTPPPDGSNAQQFEDFCAQNPGAC